MRSSNLLRQETERRTELTFPEPMCTIILSSNSEVGTAQSGVTCSVSSLSYYTELGKNWFRRKAEEAFLLWFSLIFSKMISG